MLRAHCPNDNYFQRQERPYLGSVDFPWKPYWCMPMLRKKDDPQSGRIPLLWLAATPAVFAMTFTLWRADVLWAQVPSPLEGLEIPTTLPQGSTLRVESSPSMEAVNKALEDRFTAQFSTADLEVKYQDSNTAIQAVLNDQADLAAIGRGLSTAEKQQGLTEIPLTRHKIAIVVSPSNPFNGSLTVEQFARIFRGEVTNWAQVGGPDAPIVLVDHPPTSDTRQAFRNYPMFETGSFETAPGAIALSEVNPTAIASALDANGISYLIADQALDNPALKILPMHDTLPDDPRYPFSQSLGYVYKGTPNAAVLAFLGYATNPNNEALIEEARAAAARVKAPQPTPATTLTKPEVAVTPVAPPVTLKNKIPWWPWWLAMPLLAGLLWWLTRDRGGAAALLGARDKARLILTPRNCRDAYAYWEISAADVDLLRREGHSPALRLYDVTDIADRDQQTPHSMQQFPCHPEATGDLHLPISTDDRDYRAELGYVDGDNHWHAVARSAPIRVPACAPGTSNRPSGVNTALGLGAVATAATAAATLPSLARPEEAVLGPKTSRLEKDQLILVPRNSETAYAYWELSDAQKDALRRQGRRLTLRLADVSDAPNAPAAHQVVRQYDCPDYLQDKHVEIPIDDRDYIAELGYTTTDGQWHPVVRSQPVHVPAKTTETNPVKRAASAAAVASAEARLGAIPSSLSGTVPEGTDQSTGLTNTVAKAATHLAEDTAKLTGAALTGGAAVVGTGAAAARSFMDSARAYLGKDQETGGRSDAATESATESRIILVPRSANAAYAYWEVSEAHRMELRRQGGRTLQLRIHDATNLNIDHQAAHSTQEYGCSESDQDRHVPIPVPDRDYIAELGYLTEDGRWLRLIRSFHVHVPGK